MNTLDKYNPLTPIFPHTKLPTWTPKYWTSAAHTSTITTPQSLDDAFSEMNKIMSAFQDMPEIDVFVFTPKSLYDIRKALLASDPLTPRLGHIPMLDGVCGIPCYTEYTTEDFWKRVCKLGREGKKVGVVPSDGRFWITNSPWKGETDGE